MKYNKQHTKEELLDILKNYAIKNGKNPTSNLFCSSDIYPAVSTYKRVFGSWSNAIKLAGLNVIKPGDNKRFNSIHSKYTEKNTTFL